MSLTARSTVATLCCVSREWSKLSRRALVRDIVLRVAKQASTLAIMAFLQRPALDDYLHHVSMLQLDLTTNANTLHPAMDLAVAACVLRFPSLRALAISGVNAITSFPQTSQALRRSSKLQDVLYSTTGDYQLDGDSVAFRLLQASASSLRSLELEGPFNMGSAMRRFLVSDTPQLRVLAIGEAASLVPDLGSSPVRCSASLTELHFVASAPICAEIVRLAICCLASSLRSLTITGKYSNAIFEGFTSTPLPALDFLGISSPDAEGCAARLEQLNAPRLECLGISDDSVMYLRVLRMLSKGSLGQLQKVLISDQDGDERKFVWGQAEAAFQDLLKDRGISFQSAVF